MLIDNSVRVAHNDKNLSRHKQQFLYTKALLSSKGIDADAIVKQLSLFQIAIPSWALGTGGTRFGRFPQGGEPRNLEEKMHDVALLNAINAASGSISLHIPWDIPSDAQKIRNLAKDLNLRFDAVNSNTFQDQKDQKLSYRYGSLSHTNAEVRKQAIEHNLEVVHYGADLGTNVLSLWLSDGSNFPGQSNMVEALNRTRDSLVEIYKGMPSTFELLLEYKPFEPAFYSTAIPDWGTSFLLVNQLGERAKTLVDLGHHLPNTNIEQIVGTLLSQEKLGGFHFNDSKFADDDLTTGSIKPYQLFLIFLELVEGMRAQEKNMQYIGWMIDASHNIKDPLEDLLQSVEAIMISYAQALAVDSKGLDTARQNNDPVIAQEILQDAFRTDLRPLVAEARLLKGGVIQPVVFYREQRIREDLIAERGKTSVATGL